MGKPAHFPDKERTFIESANSAILGIIMSFRTERNLRIHFLVAIFVLLISLRLGISRVELIVVILAITFVFLAEMLNTTVEILTNAFVDQEHPEAKLAKDIAAGSVLIATIGAVASGYLIFFDKIRFLTTPKFFEQIRAIPLHVAVVSLLLVMIVSIILKTFFKHGTPLRGGMPSGHAALAFATATIILWFNNDILVISAAYLLAFMVAQSRIEAKMHVWWEIIFGALIGFMLTLVLLKAFLS